MYGSTATAVMHLFLPEVPASSSPAPSQQSEVSTQIIKSCLPDSTYLSVSNAEAIHSFFINTVG
jgi:hypothetical protein